MIKNNEFNDYEYDMEDHELYKELVELEREEDQNKQKVLEYVQSQLDNDSYEDVLFSIEWSEYTYDYIITDKPKGKYQEETDFNALKGQWVNQTTNGGYIGDEFAGTISVQLNKNIYFQFSYSM
jgi:hypothetical protein